MGCARVGGRLCTGAGTAQLQGAEGRCVCGQHSGSRWQVLAESSLFSREIGSGPPVEMHDGRLETGGGREGQRMDREVFVVSPSS